MNVQTAVENRLIFPVIAFNAALGTSVSFPPESRSVPVKTGRVHAVAAQTNAKTKFDHASTLPRKACLADIAVCRLYFIAGAGLIKIGISTNLASRFRAIRNSSPVPVELLGSCPGTTANEGFLHSKFAHLRRHGEWFEDTPELRAEIEWRTR